MAATIARAMPVLPLVASISVSPGMICPRSSALRIIESAGLSFTDPAGLLPSSLARMRLLVVPGMRFKRTSGVLPTKSSRVLPIPTGLRSMPRVYSYARKRSRSAVGKQPSDISSDTGLHIGERCRKSGAAQIAQIGFGKTLILVLEAGRKWPVLDQSLRLQIGKRHGALAFRHAQGVDGGGGNVIESLRRPGAAIVDSGFCGMVQEVEIDPHNIVDRYEIATLLACCISATAFEQFHPAVLAELVETMHCDRRHPAFVSFARAINVEISQPDYLGAVVLPAPAHNLIEQEF